MKYIDSSWDTYTDKLVLSNELDIDSLGWKAGDHFKLANINGQVQLVKVDPVVVFAQGYSNA